jgi:hypothetical protein
MGLIAVPLSSLHILMGLLAVPSYMLLLSRVHWDIFGALGYWHICMLIQLQSQVVCTKEQSPCA